MTLWQWLFHVDLAFINTISLSFYIQAKYFPYARSTISWNHEMQKSFHGILILPLILGLLRCLHSEPRINTRSEMLQCLFFPGFCIIQDVCCFHRTLICTMTRQTHQLWQERPISMKNWDRSRNIFFVSLFNWLKNGFDFCLFFFADTGAVHILWQDRHSYQKCHGVQKGFHWRNKLQVWEY